MTGSNVTTADDVEALSIRQRQSSRKRERAEGENKAVEAALLVSTPSVSVAE
jgi:hypothetical protein